MFDDNDDDDDDDNYHNDKNHQVSEFAPLHSRLHTVFDGGRLGETEEAR